MKKRTLSLLLALALCVGLATPAFAAETMRHDCFGPIMDISNVNSLEKSTTYDPNMGMGVQDVYTYYTNAPTTVTLLTEGGGGNHGTFNRITEEERLSNRIAAWDNMVKPTTGEFAEDFTWVSEGATYVFEEGTYISYTTMDFSLIYIVVGAPGDAPATTNPTPAVEKPSSWAAESVSKATEAGLVPEALQEKFSQPTTRAEFCALAVALYYAVMNTDFIPSDHATFTDTEDLNVRIMATLGVVNGVGEGKFAPDATLTREQAATMLARLAAALEKPLEAAAPTFIDNGDISAWALDAVGQMQKSGVMGGVGDNTFAPDRPYTREQSIATILRLFELVK